MNVEARRKSLAIEQQSRCEFADALIAGLSARSKSIPCRFFYDAEGSALFERITQLPEYYPTRTETGILRTHAVDMARLAAPGAVLIEFGSGSSTKTELLLAKMMLVGFLIFWVRFTFPRFREDQLQAFAWKVLIPISLVNIMATMILKVAF